MCSTFISLNGNALTGPRAYFAMARDGLFPSASLPSAPQVSDAGQRRPRSRHLGNDPDDRRNRLDRRSPERGGPGLPGPILTAWKKLNETPLYDMLYHVRDLRSEPLLHAGDLERIRPACPVPGPAAAVSHAGVSAHPPALRGRRASPSGQHARRPSEPHPGPGRARHHRSGRAGVLAVSRGARRPGLSLKIAQPLES